MMQRSLAAFSLIEVIISSALIITLIGGLFAVAGASVRIGEKLRRERTALLIAEEGIAAVRQIRDSNAVSSICVNDVCPDWRTGLVALSPEPTPQIAEPLPTAKSVLERDSGYRLNTVRLSSKNPCSDYVYMDLATGQMVTQSTEPKEKSESLYCRRLIIEPMLVSLEGVSSQVQSSDVLRVRSQVAWLGMGKTEWDIGDTLTDTNVCTSGKGAKEWCTEVVTVLSGWRQL